MSVTVAGDVPEADDAERAARIAQRLPVPPILRPIVALTLWAWNTLLGSIGTFGRLVLLAADSVYGLVRDVVKLNHPWRETLSQAWFMMSVSGWPAILISVPLGAIIQIQAGSLAAQVGATSQAGAAGGLGVIRQAAPMVSGILMGGAVGAAVAADLGARKIREEIDAIRTLGINPNHRLVAPRLAAMFIVGPLMCVLVVFVGMSTIYAMTLIQGGVPGAFFNSFAAFASTTDLIIAIIKTTVFGLLVVLVASQRGFEASGGPKGVADCVNATVVLGVMTTFAANVLITQLLTIWFPDNMGF
ncbi:ABC transporter permease [Nocardia sp. 2]|uniref:ABC transporter permease n=1 Tax=Nocardia acididurans TaxID=2802282 RepID=A0ABS1MFW8_9NOCA|nr:ABC transporter permease [Nocardia acididurans]MBL1078945.1 ABC transporter permease [Nocardia acididurans]